MPAIRLPHFGLALGLAALAVPAVAAPVVYTDRSTFLAALAALPTVQDFQSIPSDLHNTEVSTPTGVGLASTYTLGGVTLDSADGITAYEIDGNVFVASGFARADEAPLRQLVITLAQASYAVGLDLLDYQSPETTGSDPMTITAFGLATVVDGTPGVGTPDFFGIIDATGSTTTLVISREEQVFYPLSLDNVTYAAAVATPEPGTLALFGIGAVLLAGIRRRA